MFALYIHIPFCLQKCSYCDFASFPVKQGVPQEYVKCICTEIDNYKNNGIILSTIYIGGGTPSLLSVEQLTQILVCVKQNFTLAQGLEFTLEANPETYEKEKFSGFKELGVNRVSLGVQSFQPKYLMYLGRVHSKEKAIEALEGIKGIFTNINIDLMNALPEQTLAEAQADLLTAVSFAPQHISCYELTYEKGAALAAVEKNELDVEMYTQTKEILEAHGYKQYEISNYARPGFEARHNLVYWSDESYLGVGLAAHSYDREQKLRWSNTSDLKKYLTGSFKIESKQEDNFNKIMMGLRKNSGVPLEYFDEKQKHKITELNEQKLLLSENGNVCLTDAGRLVLNKILLEFM